MQAHPDRVVDKLVAHHGVPELREARHQSQVGGVSGVEEQRTLPSVEASYPPLQILSIHRVT